MGVKKLFFILIFTFAAKSFAQVAELSSLAKVSLLTIGNADDLSSKFGHTAIRLKDPAVGIDVVFGYGGFNFRDPLFYYKFTTGKLDYSMTAHPYNSFIASYRNENRSVQEQHLNLSLAQKNKLFKFLKNNYLEENRYYKYDFLFDNCATKIPEVFNSIYKKSINFDSTHIKKHSTFRQLIHETLDTNSWATFGIDLALGAVIDKKASAWQHQFLPFYVQRQFENTFNDGHPLVSKSEQIVKKKPLLKKTIFVLSPLFWGIIILILVVVQTYLDHINKKRSRGIDIGLFALTGIAGVIIAFLWFATDHSSTKANFNLFWAMAPNLLVAFYIFKKQPPHWISKYLWVLLFFIFLTVIFWCFKIQIFSPLLIFILVALCIRYLFLIHWFKSYQIYN